LKKGQEVVANGLPMNAIGC